MRSSPHLPLALYFRTNQISRPDWFLLSGAEREVLGALLSRNFSLALTPDLSVGDYKFHFRSSCTFF
jgi:hypothetical protein